jgi:hypothetical protein
MYRYLLLRQFEEVMNLFFAAVIILSKGYEES